MPRQKRRRKKAEDEHSFLTIRVDRHDVRADASINHDVYAPQYAIHTSDADPLYRFETQITISGTATFPERQVGDLYEVTICGDRSPSSRLQATLKDAQACDEHGSPMYREYRGGQIPVYRPPPGLALIDKVRGMAKWTVWINVAPQLVNDMLVLLGCGRETFVEIHERKHERARWVQGLSLQTTDPSEELLAS